MEITEQIKGHGKTCTVVIHNAESKQAYILDPSESQAVCNHSPDGFNWGYGGSGPSQLALAILLHIFGEKYAKKYYQAFKHEVIAKLTIEKDFVLPVFVVVMWVIRELVIEGAGIDGGHHKQWYLCQIGDIVGVDFEDEDKGIAP